MSRMTDHSDLIARLRAACVGHPSASIAWPHRILHEAVEALSSQSISLSEALERCAGWSVSFAKKCEEHQEALREIERLKGLVAGIRETPREPTKVETVSKSGECGWPFCFCAKTGVCAHADRDVVDQGMGIPPRCVLPACKGAVSHTGKFYQCEACGASYGND